MNDGLPVNEISCIAQTQEGYMWLATFDGLVRFDGDQFTVFNSGNTSEFSTNRFATLLVDRDNNLWIITDWVGNEKALIKYHGGQFTAFGPEDGLHGDINMQLDSEGGMLVGSDNGAFFYDGKSLRSFGDKLKGRSVRNIVNDAEGAYWFSTDQGVFQYKNDDWTQLTEKNGLDSRNIYTVHINRNGQLLIGTKTGLTLWENNTLTKLLSFPAPVKATISIHEDSSGSHAPILVIDRKSMYEFRNDRLLPYPNSEVQGNYRHGVSNTPLGSRAIWSHTRTKVFREAELAYTTGGYINFLYRDNAENIWVAQSNGLVRLKPKLIKVDNKNISVVYSLIEDQEGEIWAIQKMKNLFQLQGDYFNPVTGNAGLPDKLIYSLHNLPDGRLWIGGAPGVFRWDKQNAFEFLQPFQPGDSVPELRGIKTITSDEFGNTWFGGVNGLHQLDSQGDWHYFGKVGDETLEVGILYITQDGVLWLGTNGHGLHYLEDGKLNPLQTDRDLSGNIIRSMYEDKEGILWVGTEGWGLNRLKRGNTSEGQFAEVTVYNKQNGLFDNIIHQILEDDDGRLWMSSNRGIFWVHRSELTALAERKASTIYSFSYDEEDGLPGREANGGMQPAGFKSRKGELWFPMMGGVVRIDPAQISIPTVNVLIEEISTADSTFYIGDIEKKEFPIGQRDLKISFTALEFSARPINVRFRYKLDGSDADWIEAGTQKEAIYSNLAPGTYTFNLMANNGGGWSLNQTSLEITMPYFFYETYWFYAVIILLIVGIVYGGVYWRIRLLKQKGKELEMRVEMRTQELIIEKEETIRQKDIATEALITIEKQAAALLELDKMKSYFFTNVSHEFRTPLTLIIGPLEHHIAKLKERSDSDTEDMEMALRNSKRLLKLVNQLLEIAKLESGHIAPDAHLIDIRTVIQSVADAFISLAKRNGTRFVAKLPSTPVMVYCDTDLIEKAIINLVSNAFKFTPKNGVIEIQLVPDDENVLISIKDNGAGIRKEDQKYIFDRFHQVNESSNDLQVGTGIGLSLARELVVLHGGSIELNSELGLGSEFLIKLPIGGDHFAANAQNAPQKGRKAEESTLDLGGFADTLVEESAQPLIQTPETEKNGDQPILLIVEDNADIRKYIRKQFALEYRIIEAENGQIGYEMAEEALPDLIISDVMMPVKDGYDLCRMVKEHPDLSFIPVILLTAKAEMSQKIEGLEIGADDYVIKPFKVEELKARVHNLIQSRKRLKERFTELETPPDTSDHLGWGDSPFAKQARSSIEAQLDNENFSVTMWAEELKIGRTTLYSRILELTGKTPTEAIKLSRIYRASQLLNESTGNISEVAYATGFKSVSHFSKTFKEEFGLTPSEFKRTPKQQ